MPFLVIDTVTIPEGGGELRLLSNGTDFHIQIAGPPPAQLMSSRVHGSEDALGEIPCALIAKRNNACVLIGGLGMGFTLAAALAALGEDATALVAELVPGVVEWNRGPLGDKAGRPLDDHRTEVLLEDVASVIKRSADTYDAIMLDVDNGPDGLTQQRNDVLYSRTGLAHARRALRPGGVLAVWSAAADRAFARRLREAGFRVEERTVFAHGKRGQRHTVWIGTKGSKPE